MSTFYNENTIKSIFISSFISFDKYLSQTFPLSHLIVEYELNVTNLGRIINNSVRYLIKYPKINFI